MMMMIIIPILFHGICRGESHLCEETKREEKSRRSHDAVRFAILSLESIYDTGAIQRKGKQKNCGATDMQQNSKSR